MHEARSARRHGARNLQARDKGASGHSPREKMLIVRAVACEKISASVSEGIHCRGGAW